MTFAEHVLHFNEELSRKNFELPDGFKIINPFGGEQKEVVKRVTNAFYQRYYNDTLCRRLILGSSPARRGTAVTGVPFEDAKLLQSEFGIGIDNFYINKASSDFLDDVITAYGGREKFYSDFYMNFVCPLGIVRINSKGNEMNCNYYENKKIKECLYSFMVKNIENQIDFGVDTSVCYCIGSGENYRFLSELNGKYRFFNTIIPLEHPRYIMQYNLKQKDFFVEKYIKTLCSHI